MSIKQRIKAIENKVGISDEPLVVFLRRLSSENENSPEYIKAVIIGSTTDKCIDVFMHEGETCKEFEARVEEMSNVGTCCARSLAPGNSASVCLERIVCLTDVVALKAATEGRCRLLHKARLSAEKREPQRISGVLMTGTPEHLSCV